MANAAEFSTFMRSSCYFFMPSVRIIEERCRLRHIFVRRDGIRLGAVSDVNSFISAIRLGEWI